MSRRRGLRPPFRVPDLDAMARAEQIAVAIMRGERRFRRIGDPPGVMRVVSLEEVRISDAYGITVGVRGFLASGDEDTGLACRTCPLCDLEPLDVP